MTMHDENEAAPEQSVDRSEDTVDAAVRRRTVWVHVLIVIAAVVLLLTATNVWVKRQMLDTDKWVSTSEQLLADEDIRAALSTFLVDELYSSVDVGAALEQRLPNDFSGLAEPVAAGLRGPAVEIVDRVLGSEAALEVWSNANRRAHETFLAVVRDETRPGTSTADGTVTLELREIVVKLAERLGLSESTIEQIPEDVGSVVLLESENLAEVQDAVALIEWASIVLLVVIVGLFATAVVLARGWRRVAIRHVGLAVLIDALLVLTLLRLARSRLVENYVAVPANRAAVADAWWIATTLLRDIAISGILIGAFTIIATVLVGPGRRAAAFRRVVGPKLVENPGVTWAGVLLVLLVLAIWTPFNFASTWFGIITLTAIAIATVVAIRWSYQHETDHDALPSTQSVDG